VTQAGPIEQAVTIALAATLPTVVDALAAMGGPRAYSVEQIAERLDVSRQTIYRLIRNGDLAAVPHLTPIRIAASTLDDFLRARDD